MNQVGLVEELAAAREKARLLTDVFPAQHRTTAQTFIFDPEGSHRPVND